MNEFENCPFLGLFMQSRNPVNAHIRPAIPFAICRARARGARAGHAGARTERAEPRRHSWRSPPERRTHAARSLAHVRHEMRLWACYWSISLSSLLLFLGVWVSLSSLTSTSQQTMSSCPTLLSGYEQNTVRALRLSQQERAAVRPAKSKACEGAPRRKLAYTSAVMRAPGLQEPRHFRRRLSQRDIGAGLLRPVPRNRSVQRYVLRAAANFWLP